ncbi:MAG: transcriptional regulator [Firmicutes bacterium HGW-Firmicutes-1]|nr:MAG: transcriptional regulator [Firmicutes bacterium HGW-Firmicutes-1]
MNLSLTSAYKCTYNIFMKKIFNCTKKVNEQNIDDLLNGDFFKILSEPTRLSIIKYLIIKGSSDVGTIAENFSQDRSVISRHLKMMQQSGILIVEKSSRNKVYTFDGFNFLEKMEASTAKIRELLETHCILPESKPTN